MVVKIIATVRTRNEERNIGEFCRAYYQWVDEILVADGGSTDRTVEIARRYPKVTVLNFDLTLPAEGGLDGNPQPQHYLFLRDEAIRRGADWIIFDDCDCVPNFNVRAVGRRLMEETEQGAIFLRRVYFYGPDQIFPELHEVGTSLWAWRPDQHDVEVNPEKPWRLELTVPPKDESLSLELPDYCLLHRPWPTRELTKAKINYYRKSGRHPEMLHPTEFGGPLLPADPLMRPDP